ncbi:coiled-coil domain-containing protein [Neofusicoccum parvum]|uniref:Coiled-coil domain-containing protein n=1 Tax=Neofusicoccum parvum TaxID=310453 RepID=A0ACB5RQI1_9PEZI|nr:coiled-coil domain-containing protein [Neofusicoccum parvum]
METEMQQAVPYVHKDLTPQLERLLKDVKAQQKIIRDQDSRIKAQRNMMEELYEQKNEALALTAHSDTKMDQLDKKTAQLQQKSDMLEVASKDKAALKKEVAQLKKQLESLQSRDDQWKGKFEVLNGKIEELEDDIREQSAEKRDIKKQVTTKKNEAESFRKKQKSAETKLGKTEEKLAKAEQGIAKLKEQLSSFAKDGKNALKTHQTAVVETKKLLKKSENECAKKDAEIDALQAKLRKMEQKLAIARDKRSPCVVCTDKLNEVVLHLTMKLCEDEANGHQVSLALLHQILGNLMRKFPELRERRQAGHHFFVNKPQYFVLKESAGTSSEKSERSYGVGVSGGGLCTVCGHDEVTKALYWMIEACENPQDSEFWHPELIKYVYAWQEAYPDFIKRCQAGCELVRTSEEDTEEEDVEQELPCQQEDEGAKFTLEQSSRDTKQEEMYILLLRVQQTVQAFHELGMPLTELGGAYKDFKQVLDKRQADGLSKWTLQDRLDEGKRLLDERAEYWTKSPKDRFVESGESDDLTKLTVDIPPQITLLKQELESKNEELAKLWGKVDPNYQLNTAVKTAGSSGALPSQSNEGSARSLQDHYGMPLARPGVPLVFFEDYNFP